MSREGINDLVILNKELLDYDYGKLFVIDMSWSRYSCYLDCNAKYKYKYIDGFKEETTLPLAMGKTIHDTLEAIVKYNTEDETEAIGFYLTALEKNQKEVEMSTSDIEEGKNQVINVLGRMEELTNGDFKSVKGIETGFKYLIGRALFLGFIDMILLDEDEDGPFINVIDYKTGKNKYKVKDHGQMKLYTLAVKRMFPDFRVKASLYWTRFGEIETYEFSEEELKLFEIEVLENIETLVNDRDFEPNGQMFRCCYCQFANKDMCKKGNSNRFIIERSRQKKAAKRDA
jgi:ATP-dependent helicase/DNAse subunit B